MAFALNVALRRRNIPFWKYLRNGVGHRLSLLGERIGFDWLVYNPLQFMTFHDTGVGNAPPVARSFLEEFPNATRFVDVGAGSGTYAAALRRHGHVAAACEYSRFGRFLARRQGVSCIPFDLNATPPAVLTGPFDVAYCFEVAEHLPAVLGDRLVAFLAKLAPRVVFTAAHPGQGGTGHINEQPKDYWVEHFTRHGKALDVEATRRLAQRFQANGVTATYLFENLMVFATTDKV